MSVKRVIRYEAEDQEGNIYIGKVKAKTFAKALKVTEVILEHINGLKTVYQIKLECLS